MKIFAVNEVLESPDSISGSCVCVTGILNFEFENNALYHWPKIGGTPVYRSHDVLI